MKEIISTQNEYIKYLRSLHDPRERKKSSLCLVEGERACAEFLNSEYILQELIITREHFPAAAQVPDAKVTVASYAVIKTISQATTPSGIIGIFKIPTITKPTKSLPGIVLAQIQDPGNMGTLIRTAVACKVPTIIVIEGTDPWSYKAIQASAGTIAHAQIITMTWQELLEYKESMKLCAFIVKGGKNPQEVSLKNNLIVIGNEAHGLPDAWQKDCEELVTLPMLGQTESLNAAVAGSIALYMTYVL